MPRIACPKCGAKFDKPEHLAFYRGEYDEPSKLTRTQAAAARDILFGHTRCPGCGHNIMNHKIAQRAYDDNALGNSLATVLVFVVASVGMLVPAAILHALLYYLAHFDVASLGQLPILGFRVPIFYFGVMALGPPLLLLNRSQMKE